MRIFGLNLRLNSEKKFEMFSLASLGYVVDLASISCPIHSKISATSAWLVGWNVVARLFFSKQLNVVTWFDGGTGFVWAGLQDG